MRTAITYGLLAAAVALTACHRPERQEPNNPIGTENPKPQKAATAPTPRPDRDPLEPKPQKPLLEPKPQKSALGQPKPQQPLTNPKPQQSIFGPPADQSNSTASTEKAKTGEETGERAKTSSGQKGTSAKGELTDGEILGVVLAADRGEVQMAEVARKQATSSEVKEFASWMISQHGAGEAKAKALQTKSNLEPKSSAISKNLENEVHGTVSSLRGQKGASFDEAYIDSQVKTHTEVLRIFDQQLIPNADDAQLKADLKAARAHISDHLARAKAIQKDLAK